MSDSIQCLRCQTTMEPGFVADLTYGGYAQEKWTSGTPEASFWRGLKIENDQAVPVTTMRCPKCGYLESYAR